jgi:hypothetical protein
MTISPPPAVKTLKRGGKEEAEGFEVDLKLIG